MTTLTSAPLAPLLDRLFAEAEAAEAELDAAIGDMTPDELAQQMRSKTGYLAFYGRLKDAPLAVSRETGALLYMLARSSGARSIVEFGTSFGLSTLFLAAALRDNGGGRLVTAEFEPSKVVRARANIAAGGLADLVELREGDALETLAAGLPDAVDLLLLDGSKALYPEILALVEPRLRPGAVIVADDAHHSPDYLARVRSPAAGRPRRATCRCPAAETSSCRCGSDGVAAPPPTRSGASVRIVAGPGSASHSDAGASHARFPHRRDRLHRIPDRPRPHRCGPHRARADAVRRRRG